MHDKDTFKVVAKYRFGWNHGIDVVPGGKDGAVRFAWVFTPNWIGRLCKNEKLPLYGIVQFVELKDGQVFDFTEHGAGSGRRLNADFTMVKLTSITAVALCALAASAKNFSVRDYGAKGDGAAKDTAAIQRAVDAAYAAG